MKTQEASASNSGKNTIANLLADEWARFPKPKARFWGLARTTLLEMADRGEIKATSIRKKGAVRGIRLFYVPSLREALERLSKEGKNR